MAKATSLDNRPQGGHQGPQAIRRLAERRALRSAQRLHRRQDLRPPLQAPAREAQHRGRGHGRAVQTAPRGRNRGQAPKGPGPGVTSAGGCDVFARFCRPSSASFNLKCAGQLLGWVEAVGTLKTVEI